MQRDLIVTFSVKMLNPEALDALREAASILEDIAEDMPWRTAEINTAVERMRFAAANIRVVSEETSTEN